MAPNLKPNAVTNIKLSIPIVLDLEESNYDTWSELFTLHCTSVGVLSHINGTAAETEKATPEWVEHESLIKLWVIGTVSKNLIQRVLKKEYTAHYVWKKLHEIFTENKCTRTMQLQTELRNLDLGTMSITEYFHKVRRISDLLTNLGSPVPDQNLVFYALGGLGERFDYFARIIRLREEIPSLAKVESLLLSEASELAQKHKAQTSSGSVLMTQQPRNTKNSLTPVCRNFQRGHCTFGSQCRFLHTMRSNGRGSSSQWRSFAPRGRNPSNIRPFSASRPHQPRMSWSSFDQTPASPSAIAGYHGYGLMSGPPSLPSGPYVTGPAYAATGPSFGAASSLGPSTGFSSQLGQPTGQPTYLPHAFTAGTLPDVGDSGWTMDSGATSHLASNTGSLDQTSATPM